MIAHHTNNVQSVKWNLDMSIILTSASFYGSLVVLDGRASSVLQFLALDGRHVDGTTPPQPQHPRLTSKEVMTVIVYDVRKGHSAPFHRYQAHSTVSAFDPTNRAALMINAARFIRSNECKFTYGIHALRRTKVQGDVVDTHMHYVDDYVA
ncbi:hypothetical protein H257_17113 [Aphanomyces astaci]|uniref:Uncharacterized protein n=1 Tax=Aphanomyces astaci TaxID=112090 RepID=W4FG77_APHAT|nr:hypothetical protein H257_17113 [Aphanomyces astaci]ETV66445.1 hypothetical protein H257_17113 [Aphanomyces astaci]|eukprot:XP_009844079.1 hypothetical protein H257_17113 [Aphanomyces astaci]